MDFKDWTVKQASSTVSDIRPQGRAPHRGSVLGIEHMPASEITSILTLARKMNPAKSHPLLKGKKVLLLFYEASTRTRSSFEIAEIGRASCRERV